MGDRDDVDVLLDEQQRYYRARAGEYDDWWERRGRYDLGPEHTSAWGSDVAELVAVVDRLAPGLDVLELAAGTGNWTGRLADHADRVTAVDGSAETLAINRGKLGARANVDFVVADLFSWEPPRRFDAVLVAFWLSHVPDERLDDFWDLLDRSLKPAATLLVFDSAHPSKAASETDSGVDVHYTSTPGHRQADPASHRARRTLADGREFEIVKRFWGCDELEAAAAEHGWSLTVRETDRFFLIAEGVRST